MRSSERPTMPPASPPLNTTASRWRRTTGLALAGLVALLLADMEIARSSPGQELLRMAKGFMTPAFFATDQLGQALANTLASAWQGTALAALFGFFMAAVWSPRAVRSFAASIPAVPQPFGGPLPYCL